MRTGTEKALGRPHTIELDGAAVVVRTRRHPKARRITLSIDPRGDCAVLTLPRGVSVARGLEFVREKTNWLTTRLAALPPRTPFTDDALIPYRGRPIRLRHFPLAGPRPVLGGDELYVPGAGDTMAEHVRTWLKGEANAVIGARTAEKARIMGRAAPPYRLADPRSRWGSCSPDGRVRFSWRLIMAPDPVLDYVVAHEVAHLAELNHGPAFHAIVAELTEHHEHARTWLNREGQHLLRYG